MTAGVKLLSWVKIRDWFFAPLGNISLSTSIPSLAFVFAHLANVPCPRLSLLSLYFVGLGFGCAFHAVLCKPCPVAASFVSRYVDTSWTTESRLHISESFHTGPRI